jgi:hypothetical protein
MPELDPFEARLRRAVRAYADRAETRVDPFALAERVVERRGFGSLVWLGRPLPIRGAILLVLGLLVAILAWSVQVGAPWDRRTSVAPLPAVTATPSPANAAATTPAPTTDGAGDERVSGSGTFSILTSGTSTRVGDVTQIRGFVATATNAMNDPRVTGAGALHLSIDTHGAVGSEWGTYRLVNAGGAWEGEVRGAAWDSGESSDVAGWLVGTGSYEGSTYYIQIRSVGTSTEIDGIVFPGPPPMP